MNAKRAKRSASVGTIKVTGDERSVSRMPTWFSLDVALGGGMPVGIVEISGYPGTGKSSLSYALAALCCASPYITVAPFEDYTANYIVKSLQANGFSGNLHIVPISEKKKARSSEDILDELITRWREYGGAVVIDSIGAIIPTGEAEGSIADANMGAQARVVARLLRALSHAVRVNPNASLAILPNHVHSIMGARGTVTSGGMAMQYLTTVRLRMSKDQDDLPNDAIIVKGRVDRLKYKDTPTDASKDFWAAILPQSNGFHAGLTAVIDCEKYGFATRDNGVIRMGGKSYGRISRMVETADTLKQFEPFLARLQQERKKWVP